MLDSIFIVKFKLNDMRDKKVIFCILNLFFIGFLVNAQNQTNLNYYIDERIADLKVENNNSKVFHLFSHGKSTKLFIEDAWRDAPAIAQWLTTHNFLQNKQHLNIYGCNFAKGEKGKAAVQYLERALNITVAASNNVTGNKGDWDLEVGTPQSSLKFNHYPHSLQCPSEDALVNTYSQVATCVAKNSGDPVLVLSNAPSQTYQNNTYAVSATNNPTTTPPAGVVGEYMHPDWTIDQIGTIYFTEFGPDGSVYIPASRFTAQDFNAAVLGGPGLQQTGAIGNACTSGTFDGWDVIYVTDPLTGAVSCWSTGIETNSKGFGGITYNEFTNTFYVTNLGDCSIYQLDTSGNILDTYTATGLGISIQRPNCPFGLDVNPLDQRLYYTVTESEILHVRSIALDPATGNFIASTDVQEVYDPFPDVNFSSNAIGGTPVVADIDFSPAGRMAIGSFTSLLNEFYENDKEQTLYNHGAGVFIYDGTSQSYSRSVFTSVGYFPFAGSDNNYTSTGGVAWNVDPALPAEILWMSGGDFNNEDSNWGIVGYNSTQLDNTESQENASSYIQYLFESDPNLDPKGNGGDVDVFLPCICDAEAGTLNPTTPVDCDEATLTATVGTAPIVPNGFEVLYVLTSGSGLVIEQTAATPSFGPLTTGTYTIHTLVYNPATLDLTTIVPGTTTGFDVNALLIQGGGDICASLDVAGAQFIIEDCPCPPENCIRQFGEFTIIKRIP